MVLVAIPDRAEWVWFWSYNVASVMMLVFCVMHSRKLYQDLFTKERACFAHRRTKPEITAEYKFVQWLTALVLYFGFGGSFLFGLEMASYTGWSHQTCRNLNNAGGWFLVLGKGCMYMLFMYRLIICYGDSAIGYRNWKPVVVCIGWLNIVFAIVAESITTYNTVKYYVFAQDFDEFPNPCWPIVTSPRTTVFAKLMQVWDGIMNPLSLILFILPLRKLHTIERVMSGIDNAVNHSVQRTRDKVRYLAVKYTILTFVAFFSTLIFWMLVYVAPDEYFLVSFDVVINSACVMLMTAYYDDRVYYERLCCCFLLCCRKSLMLSGDDQQASEKATPQATEAAADATMGAQANSSASRIETQTPDV